MLGNPCDARASYCQAPGLPLAAAADRGDQADFEAAQAASACHARHANRCPCHRTHDVSQACPAGRAASVPGGLPSYAVLAAQVADRCVAFERTADPDLDERAARAGLEQAFGLLEAWYGAAVRRTCAAGGA